MLESLDAVLEPELLRVYVYVRTYVHMYTYTHRRRRRRGSCNLFQGVRAQGADGIRHLVATFSQTVDDAGSQCK